EQGPPGRRGVRRRSPRETRVETRILPSARGSGVPDGRRSSDSGLPPSPPSQPGGQWHVAQERLPSQRRDRSGLAPDSLAARRFVGRGLASGAVAGSPLATGWLPGLAWAAGVFAVSSIPSLSARPPPSCTA